jgi:phospholipase D1/2
MRSWSFRWFIITDEAIGYLENSNGALTEYNYFTQYFNFKIKPSRVITLRFGYRTLYMRFNDDFTFLETIYSILRAYKTFMDRKNYQFNRSFPDNGIRFYLNGEIGQPDYFSDIYEAIESAKYEIYITDWFLAPHIWLKRPMEDFPEARLDKTLMRACQRGVQVS